VPWLVVQGEADELVDWREVVAWAEALERPPRVERLADTSHFFHGRLNALQGVVEDFLRKTEERSDGD